MLLVMNVMERVQEAVRVIKFAQLAMEWVKLSRPLEHF
jgi:hypothetical protein